jgi:histidinol-phosphate aminotransferase
VDLGVTDVEVASLLRLVRIPFGVGSIALAAAVASIDAGPELAARVEMVQAERDRVATQLTGLGWEIPSSQANFLWIAAGEAQATAAACLCAESKVLVRQLPGGLRVTIGTEKENARLLDALGSPADLPPTRSAAGGSASRADPCSSSPLISS